MNKQSTECKCYWYDTADGVRHLIQCNKCGKNDFKIKTCPCHCHGNCIIGKCEHVFKCEHCQESASRSDDLREQIETIIYDDDGKMPAKQTVDEIMDLLSTQRKLDREEIARQLDLTVLMHEKELEAQPKIIESLGSKIRAFIKFELLDK